MVRPAPFPTSRERREEGSGEGREGRQQGRKGGKGGDERGGMKEGTTRYREERRR